MDTTSLPAHIIRRKEREAALSLGRARHLFNYDPLTGALTNAVPRGAQGRYGVGFVQGAGQPSDDHIRVNVDGVIFLAHRLIWFMVKGAWPDDELDHRDRNKKNNRLANLREADRMGNGQNMPRQNNNKSGHAGVSWGEAHGKWRAYITVSRRQVHLGWFGSIEEAIAAREAAKPVYHPFSAGNISDGLHRPELSRDCREGG